MASDSVSTSNPPTLALPPDGASRPQRIRMVVDLPAPLGPRNPKISPLLTLNEMWSTATKSPNRLTRSSTSTAQPVVSAAGIVCLLAFHESNGSDTTASHFAFGYLPSWAGNCE